MRTKAVSDKKGIYFIYTIKFFIAILLLFSVFFYHQKTVIRYCDGLNQYFYSLCYYGEWLRGLFQNIFIEHKFEVPLWDMSIGYGADILTSLHYYGLNDPLNILAVFVDREHMEYLYVVLLVIRLYLAGICFIVLCRYHGCKDGAACLAAIVYCFAGWTILSGIRWVEFSTPLILLPLLIMGIDKIYRGESAKQFCICVALAAAVNFYFFYMLCFCMLFYGVAGYFLYHKELTIKAILKEFGKFTGLFIVGIGMTAMIWLPICIVLLGGARGSAEYYIPVLFSKSFYLSLPVSFITASDVYNAISAGWGFAPVAVVSIVLLFTKKKQNTVLQGLVLFSMAAFCIPYFSHLMNGFAYVAHRWAWAAGLVVCFCLAKILPEFYTLDRKQKYVLTGALLCYIPLLRIIISENILFFSMLVLLVAVFGGIILFSKDKRNGKILTGILHITTFVWIAVNSWNIYGAGSNPNFFNYIDVASAETIIKSENLNLISELSDEDIFRYDTLGADRYANWNLAMLLGIHGTQFYYSVTDSNVFDYYKDVYMLTSSNFSYQNLDGRTILSDLAGVKYFIIRNGEEYYLPYGYEKKVSDNGTYSVYQNNQTLPLGYTYDGCIVAEEWEKLSAVQKQYAMLQGCIMEESNLPKANLDFRDRKVNVSLPPEMQKESNGYRLECEKADEKIALKLEEKIEADSELYLILEGVEYTGKDRTSNITVSCGPLEKQYEFRTNRDGGFCGIQNLMYNLGIHSEAKEIEISFERAGTYRFKNIEVVQQPMEEVPQYLTVLREASLRDMTIEGNRITGAIEVDRPKALLIAVPYSTGWSAYVDGEKTELKKANGMFMALELEPGEHEICLKYRTPWLYPGICISIISIVIFIGGYVYYERKKRREQNRDDNM